MKKFFLVLVGGGGCGRWQCGALSNLDSLGLLSAIGGIVGTSVGGINATGLAASMVQGKGSALLVQAWNNIQKNTDIFIPDISSLSLLNSPWMIPQILWNLWNSDGLVDTDPLKKNLSSIVGSITNSEVQQKLGFPIYTRAFNYGDTEVGQAGEMSLTGNLLDMALASSAIEGIFPSHLGFGDGGAFDNAPIDVALNLGAEVIAVVYCGPDNPEADGLATGIVDPAVSVPKRNLFNNLESVLNQLVAQNETKAEAAALEAEKNGTKVFHIYPASDTGSALDFSPRGLFERGVSESKAGWSQLVAALNS